MRRWQRIEPARATQVAVASEDFSSSGFPFELGIRARMPCCPTRDLPCLKGERAIDIDRSDTEFLQKAELCRPLRECPAGLVKLLLDHRRENAMHAYLALPFAATCGDNCAVITEEKFGLRPHPVVHGFYKGVKTDTGSSDCCAAAVTMANGKIRAAYLIMVPPSEQHGGHPRSGRVIV
jgi:hypothetical protein